MPYYFNCSRCGRNRSFRPVSEDDSALGCLLFLFGGILPALLFLGHQRTRVQCSDCGHIFRQPRLPKSDAARYSGWIILILFTTLVFVMVVQSVPLNFESLPEFRPVELLAEQLKSAPRFYAYVILVVVGLLLFACLIASLRGNQKHRKEIGQTFQLRVPPEFNVDDPHMDEEARKSETDRPN